MNWTLVLATFCLVLGVWVTIKRAFLIMYPIYALRYWRRQKFYCLYDACRDQEPVEVFAEMHDIAIRRVSAVSHERAFEKFRPQAYYAFRRDQVLYWRTAAEIYAMYIVVPAIIWYQHIWIVLASYFVGALAAVAYLYYIDGLNPAAMLLVHSTVSHAYRFNKIKLRQDRENEAMNRAVAELAAEAEAKATSPAPSSLWQMIGWRIFAWGFLIFDALSCAVLVYTYVSDPQQGAESALFLTAQAALGVLAVQAILLPVYGIGWLLARRRVVRKPKLSSTGE